DGIRDLIVTGVQTCALPIYDRPDLLGPGREVADERLHLGIPVGLRRAHDADVRGEPLKDAAEILPVMLDPVGMAAEGIRHVDERSEERRVGKEWRAQSARER